MSVLTDLIYGGSHAVAGLTEGAVNDAIAKFGADKAIAFPDTAYFFPTIYAATGVKVAKLGDLPACVGVLKSLITDQEDLGQALNAGLATAVGAEIIEGLKYLDGAEPYANETGIGFVPDPVIRSLGVPLVTGDIPGVAVVLGKADNAADVVSVVKDYQSKGILTFLIGGVIDQCAEGGVKMGLELRVVPLGHDVTAVIHVVTVAIRAALIFGNVQPGDLPGLLKYTKERVPAFVNTFGAIDNVVVSAGAGAIALGFPVVVDIDLGENQVPGALESVLDHSLTVKHSLELRNIKIKTKELPIPVAFAAAFEGEIIRKADMHTEYWSGKNATAELVLMRDPSEIEDHKITILGDDMDGGEKNYALCTFIEVAGAKMQADFESVIERKIHAWFNYMEGVMHTGQRNQVRVRVSNDAFAKGLRLKHFGEVLYHMIMDEFDAVVDKCQVTLITDEAAAEKFMDANPDVSVSGSGNGSGKGLTAVAAGTVTIGNSDVFAETKLEADQVKNLVDHDVAVVGMGPVVSKNVTVDDLSLEQLKGIFSGQITNWKEVGGDDATIVVLNRKAGSGTRATFEAAVFGDEANDFKGDAELDKSGDVQTQMASTDNAISYLDFSHFDDSKFNAIKVEGVEPKSANVTDDSFKIWATEHMYCSKDADEATTAFLEFMLSDDVQGKLVEEQGFIPVSAMKVVKDASGKVSAK